MKHNDDRDDDGEVVDNDSPDCSTGWAGRWLRT